MALLESVSGFSDLFTDPPEFGILHASWRQQINNYIRVILVVLALLLLAKQLTESAIECLSAENSTLR